MGIQDMLVYATPFEIEKGKWGYKWIGFCYGKRFSMIQNPYITEMTVDKENNEYIFFYKSQIELLPTEIQKFIYGVPLSNHYFLYGEHRPISIEVVMQLIEKGYDIENISMRKHLSLIDKDETFLCKYLDKETEKVIVEIIDDETILWKGDCL